MQGKTSNAPSISSIKDFEIISELGKGSFGIVYKVKRKTDSNLYALKKVYLSKLKAKEKENSLNEIRILASISHPNIIEYKDAFYDDVSQCLCLVMEYADYGDLERKIVIKERSKQYYTEPEALRLFIQITKGLKALHEANIVHRDMKAANVFIFRDDVVKIGDFNVSKLIKSDLKHTQTGTPFYASPEVWDNVAYDYKTDIWSLGCLLYEICALRAPFRGNTMKMVYDKVKKGLYEPIPRFYSKGLGGLIYVCLQTNPLHRPTCTQLLSIICNQASTFYSISTELLLLCQHNSAYVNKMINEERNVLTDVNDYSSREEEKRNQRSQLLLGTIKLPRRMGEINQVLPKNNYASSATRRVNSAAKLFFKLPKVLMSTQDNNPLKRKLPNHSTLLNNNSDINLLMRKAPREDKYSNIINYKEIRSEEDEEIKEEIHLSSHNSGVFTDNNQEKAVPINRAQAKISNSPRLPEPMAPLRKIQINKREIMASIAKDPNLQLFRTPIVVNPNVFKRNLKSQQVGDVHNITDININSKTEEHKPQNDFVYKDRVKEKDDKEYLIDKINRKLNKRSEISEYIELKPVKSNVNLRAGSALIPKEDIATIQPISKLYNNLYTIDSLLSKYHRGYSNNISVLNKNEMSDQRERREFQYNCLPTIDRTDLQIPSVKANDQPIHAYHKNLNAYNKKEGHEKKASNLNNLSDLNIAQPFFNNKLKIQNIPVKLCKLPFDNKKINFESHETISNEVNKIIRGYKMIKKEDIPFI